VIVLSKWRDTDERLLAQFPYSERNQNEQLNNPPASTEGTPKPTSHKHSRSNRSSSPLQQHGCQWVKAIRLAQHHHRKTPSAVQYNMLPHWGTGSGVTARTLTSALNPTTTPLSSLEAAAFHPALSALPAAPSPAP